MAARTSKRVPDVLAILAHHDDEFFLAPLIRDECAAGAAVHVCFLTHGSLQGTPAEVRVRESRGVLAGLGVGDAQVMDLGVRDGIFDGGLAAMEGGALAALTRRYATQRFARVYLMAWEGGHPDHDAAHMIGLAYADRSQRESQLFEVPLYNSYAAPPGLCRVMTLVPRPGSELLERKLTAEEAQACARLMDAYPSQQEVFNSLAPAIQWGLFTRRSFQYRELGPRPDHALRPHSGPLFYEQKFPLNFEVFRERMRSLGTGAPSEGLQHRQQHDG